MLAGLVPSSQKVGSLLKKTLAGKAGQKILAKRIGKIGCCLQTNSKNRKKYKESRIIFTQLLMIIHKIGVP
jgi:hypothetical protein